jgi:LmbE family N-acetylglucosaminyl deacetylase
VVGSIVGLVAVALALTAVYGRPRGAGGSRAAALTDPVAAKAAGDALLASRDATVVISVAHPDDAEWYAGGTAIALARTNRVIVLLGTSGDRGAGGWPGIAAVRERLELETAKVAGYHDVVFLRHPDQGLAEAASYPAEVEGVLSRYGATIVVTFDEAKEAQGYRHVDHEAAGRTSVAAARRLGGVTVYGMSSSAADVLVDYYAVRETKRTALGVVTGYRSANPLYAWFVAPVQRALNGPPQPTYGQRVAAPSVGVEYGELFRKVVVP